MHNLELNQLWKKFTFEAIRLFACNKRKFNWVKLSWAAWITSRGWRGWWWLLSIVTRCSLVSTFTQWVEFQSFYLTFRVWRNGDGEFIVTDLKTISWKNRSFVIISFYLKFTKFTSRLVAGWLKSLNRSHLLHSWVKLYLKFIIFCMSQIISYWESNYRSFIYLNTVGGC